MEPHKANLIKIVLREGSFPLSWCLLVHNVMKDLQKEGFLVYGYADDIPISMMGNFLNTLRDFMINALKIVQRWCETKGLPVNPLKTSIMVFTRKYKPEPIQPIRPEEKANCLHLFGEIFWSLTRPLIKSQKEGRNFTPLCGCVEQPWARLGELASK
jgi:hypothetical protein